MLRICSILVLLAALAFATPMAVALPHDDKVRVVDGDTLDWQGTKLRLFGIDAPERDQSCDRNGQSWACGRWSATMLARAIGPHPVTCVAHALDRYGRTLATCTAGGTDLAQAQVRTGAAQAYLRYSRRYLADQDQARQAGLGVWAGHMASPEAHRRTSDLPADVAPGACTIKGNISGDRRIYHRPGQRDYDKTRIRTDKGEAWFCTEAEARAAGFRPARR